MSTLPSTPLQSSLTIRLSRTSYNHIGILVNPIVLRIALGAWVGFQIEHDFRGTYSTPQAFNNLFKPAGVSPIRI
jgi:hypothetical protein